MHLGPVGCKDPGINRKKKNPQMWEMLHEKGDKLFQFFCCQKNVDLNIYVNFLVRILSQKKVIPQILKIRARNWLDEDLYKIAQNGDFEICK